MDVRLLHARVGAGLQTQAGAEHRCSGASDGRMHRAQREPAARGGVMTMGQGPPCSVSLHVCRLRVHDGRAEWREVPSYLKRPS